MSIITPSIFIAEISIPQTANYFENGGNLQEFIDKYEKKFLLELFGVTFYNELIAGLTPVPVEPPTDPETFEPIPQKWLDLVNDTDLKAMIANYVYYWWKRDETTQSMGISETKPKAENATVTNSVDKQVRAWNEMVRMVRLFDLSTTTYPNFIRRYWRRYNYWYHGCDVPEIYYFINSLNF